jgi:lipopolysaccharide/colanic/teichoic acid biosynthesis glycosyltransferase
VIALDPQLQVRPVRQQPTLWGVGAEELHDRLWASVGVRVVRRGRGGADVGPLPRGGAYLLVRAHALVTFDADRLRERLARNGRSLLFLRLSGERSSRFVERVVLGPEGEFHRFERDYKGGGRHHGRCAMTADPETARRWREAPRGTGLWRWLRAQTPAERRSVRTVRGHAFDALSDVDVPAFVRAAMGLWPRPDLAIDGVVRRGEGVWAAHDADVESSAVVLGSAWVGRNRRLCATTTVIGPAVIWDSGGDLAADGRAIERLPHADHEHRGGESRRDGGHARDGVRIAGKRAFDVVFSLLGLLVTLPLYPLIMLAIWLEDGGPFFYGHRREGRHGREFPCWKFRSMRKDADQVRGQLQAANQADGPQFFMTNDPRLTRVGVFLRRLNLDELPQFWNVIRGDMSVVGPRPSPHAENQFCPEWREARLSVRPGITGLWQVSRTRQAGSDFQEWIKYDIEYVDRASWRSDLSILARTVVCLLKKDGR